jgi:predicted transcriptional regulator YdeE
MNIIHLQEIYLTGLALSTKTSNENGKSSIDCENLWHEFHKQKYADKIIDKLSDDIYGVYFDYDGDSTRPFNYFIGYKVSKEAVLPPGLQSLIIPEGRFEKVTAKGKMPGCVTEAWKQIWESPLERAYKFDFEIYDERSKNWEDAIVEVFVSIK